MQNQKSYRATDKQRTKHIQEKTSLETEISNIGRDSEVLVETIKTLRENGNNISGRPAAHSK